MSVAEKWNVSSVNDQLENEIPEKVGPEEAGEERFAARHIGPDDGEISQMLEALGASTLGALIDKALPQQIRLSESFSLTDFPQALSEPAALARLRRLANKNDLWRSFIGMGYSDCHVPAVIQRNVLENPGWYTQYTPYQPEISQGRLEALLNFQTVISELTGLPIANASLLDEGTAAAEAMSLSYAMHARKSKGSAKAFFVSEDCHPQTIDIVRTRAEALEFEVIVGSLDDFAFGGNVFGALIQYPNTYGEVADPTEHIERAKKAGTIVTVATDLLALVMLHAPSSIGADIVVGNSQRFGVPLGYGGPHAAFMATREEYKRSIPGRLVGVSKDRNDRPALRLALQTREQHIRREKATSNICTAQVLLAVMAGMYAVYHGPQGLRRIAQRTHLFARRFATGLRRLGLPLHTDSFFDTVRVDCDETQQREIIARAAKQRVNLRQNSGSSLCVSFDETCGEEELELLLKIFAGPGYEGEFPGGVGDLVADSSVQLLPKLRRTESFLDQEVFHRYRSETEFLRYLKKLESRDLSLAVSMIPLGSCTMKLNATTEMLPVSWPEFSRIHPFVPVAQTKGYQKLFSELERALAEITGFHAVSLQPNAGSQGEYAGLLAIRAYHRSRDDNDRNICLIPKSAHGTNPASAVMAGMRVVVVDCDDNGNIDLDDLASKAKQHAEKLSALMITYPSTHGVFETSIKEVCQIVHDCGGQVYVDGANLNAMVGLSKIAELGGDVCHINLHKTFCIPHGGGGPGMGPIGVAEHLAPFLPGHGVVEMSGDQNRPSGGSVSAAPWGSASILPISWAYMALMGEEGLKHATEVAILCANYIAKRLDGYYPVLYKGEQGLVAHECILDLRAFKKSCGIEVEDVAKRLMDYGFHAPTISWPVPGTMMVEPTESESLAELDRFCEAMISIRAEIKQIEAGELDRENNPLKNAPHTSLELAADDWDRPYSREQAAFPAPWTKEYKFWPATSRIDSAYGDKNLVCTCEPIESFAE